MLERLESAKVGTLRSLLLPIFYGGHTQIEMWAQDAGLKVGQIEMSGSAEQCLNNVLRAANSGGVQQILKLLDTSPVLDNPDPAITDWRRDLKQRLGQDEIAACPRLLPALPTLPDALLDGFGQQLQDLKDLLQTRRLGSAIERGQTLCKTIEPLWSVGMVNERLRQQHATAQLLLGAARLGTQERELAAELLLKVKPEHLDMNARVTLCLNLLYAREDDRAREVLALLPPKNTAKTIIEIRAGSLPEGEDLSPVVALERARFCLGIGRSGETAERMLKLARSTPDDDFYHLDAVLLLCDATYQMLHSLEIDPEPLSSEGLIEVFSFLEIRLSKLRSEALDPALLPFVLSSSLRFYTATDHEPGVEAIDLIAEVNQLELRTKEGPYSKSRRAAEKGHLDDALRALDSADDGWWASLARVPLLLQLGKSEEALQGLERLHSEWPQVAPVHLWLARVRKHTGEIDQATYHAKTAFQLFPGWGYRLEFAHCLLRSGQTAEGWELLKEQDDPDHEMWLKIKANLAFASAPQEARSLFEHSLRLNPADALWRLYFAGFLLGGSEIDSGIEELWRATTHPGKELLRPEAFFEAARLQGATSADPNIQRARATDIVRAMCQLHPQAPETHAAILLLRGQLDEVAELPQVDFRLLETAGFVQSFEMPDLMPTLRAMRQQQEKVVEAWLLGACTGEHLRSALSLSSARWVTDCVRGDRGPTDLIGGPVHVLAAHLDEDLKGKEMLLGEVELLLLDELDLLDGLDHALGEGGAVLIFEDVLSSLIQAIVHLRQSQPERSLKSIEALASELERGSASLTLQRPDETSTDQRCSELDEAPVVALHRDQDDSDELTFSALIQRLWKEGYVERPQLKQLTEGLPLAQLGPQLASTYTLSLSLLRHLHRKELLPLFLQVMPGRLIVSGASHWQLHEEMKRSRLDIDALHRALRLSKWIQDARLDDRARVISRPDTSQLKLTPRINTEYEGWLRRAFSWHTALLESDSRLVATTDFWTGSWYTPNVVSQWGQLLLWDDETKEFISTLQETPPRLLTLPALVRAIARGDVDVQAKLASWGIPDSLNADDLIQLSARLETAKGGRIAGLLQSQDCLIRHPVHLGRLPGDYQRGYTLGQAVWKIWKREDLSEERKLQDIHAWLDYAEEGDGLTGTEAVALESLFLGALSESLRDLKEWYIPKDQDTLLLSPESPALKLWAHLCRLSTEHAEYRRALTRSWWRLLQSHFSALDQQPHRHDIGLLVAAIMKLEHTYRPPLTVPVELEALSILSEVFNLPEIREIQFSIAGADGDLTSQPLGDLLQQGQKALEGAKSKSKNLKFDPKSLSWQVDLTSHKGVFTYPMEAMLLGLSPESLTTVAAQVHRFFGPMDGRLYDALSTLSEQPTDSDARTAFATIAAFSPWRRLQVDPGWLLTWGQGISSNFEFPQRIEDLRALLSEPESLTPDKHINILLHDRLESGGVWAQRKDGQFLLSIALSPVVIGTRYAFEEAESFWKNVDQLIQPLRDAHNLPACDIAHRVIGLGFALADIAKFTSPTDRNLDHELTHAIEALVSAEHPDESQLAHWEDALLRQCFQVVTRLHGGKHLSERDSQWLVYRLHHWLILVLINIPRPERIRAWMTLAGVAPAERPEDSADDALDLLHPLRFGGDGASLRCLTLLHSLLVLGELEILAIREGNPPQDFSFKKSEVIREFLVDIAAKKLSQQQLTRMKQADSTALGWSWPPSEPAMALQALLNFDYDNFYRLSLETRLRWWRLLMAGALHPSHSLSLMRSMLLSMVGQTSELDSAETEQLRIWRPGDEVHPELRGLHLASRLYLRETQDSGEWATLVDEAKEHLHTVDGYRRVEALTFFLIAEAARESEVIPPVVSLLEQLELNNLKTDGLNGDLRKAAEKFALKLLKEPARGRLRLALQLQGDAQEQI